MVIMVSLAEHVEFSVETILSWPISLSQIFVNVCEFKQFKIFTACFKIILFQCIYCYSTNLLTQ